MNTTIQNYIFILGQSSDLAKEELFNLLKSQTDEQMTVGDNFLMAKENINPIKFINQLGGTIKIARHLKTIDQLNFSTQEWADMIKIEPDKKIKFGFSVYNGREKDFKKIQALALSVKKQIKEKGHSIRLVSSREPELSSVIVTKNKLLNAELLFIRHQGQWIIGLTQAVQDFKSYAQRDAYRPRKDNRSGMLPPKVAQMMINLTGADRNKIILDPFCGSGTVLQEAALFGFKKIYGTDNSHKAVDDSQINLGWLEEQYDLSTDISIKKIPVEQLANKLNNTVDLIVTEPFMGDARLLQRAYHKKDVVPIINELQSLYQMAFRQFKKIINQNGKVVFIFPVIDLGNEKISTLDTAQISNIGWQAIKPKIQSKSLSLNGNIIYSRPGQNIQRQITIWQSK